jgi:hypothetical protein
MRRDYRQPTRSEWQRITSACPIVCRVVLRRTNLTRHRKERLKAPKGGGGVGSKCPDVPE